jgi:plastocyanin
LQIIIQLQKEAIAISKFDSSPNFNPLLAPGQTFKHTFAEAGEYPYFCVLHPNMVGTVSVS